ncbi:MAG: shikimate dehydrogenase [Candidatus Hydrothermarchaeaceae archaeon]
MYSKVFCVIGDPIEHSLSPVMHNAVFKSLGLNYTYEAFKIVPKSLGGAIRGFKTLGVKGVNVTIPHKVRVIKYLDELSEEAGIIGAVNTIKIDEKLRGYNTDGVGALRALKSNGVTPEGRKVVMLGSGGAARAIAVTLALRENISSLAILGIEEKELAQLVSEISKNTKVKPEGVIMTKDAKREWISRADILIHCTPVGMHPNTGKSLVTADMLHSDLAVMDIVYTPLETKLMKEANEAGVRKIIGGVDMFVNQGAESLKIWLGIDAPVKLMREVVVDRLKN